MDYYEKYIDLVNVDLKERFYDNLFKSFQIDLENFIKTVFVCLKSMNITINDIYNLDYWEWELLLEELKEYLEKEKKEREEQEKEYSQIMSSVNKYKDFKLDNISKSLSNLNRPFKI